MNNKDSPWLSSLAHEFVKATDSPYTTLASCDHELLQDTSVLELYQVGMLYA